VLADPSLDESCCHTIRAVLTLQPEKEDNSTVAFIPNFNFSFHGFTSVNLQPTL